MGWSRSCQDIRTGRIWRAGSDREANGIASWGAGNAGKGPSPTTFGGQTHCTVIHNNFVPSPRQASSHLHAMCSVCPVLWYIGRLRVYKSATWNRASKLDELHSAPILHTPTTISALHPILPFNSSSIVLCICLAPRAPRIALLPPSVLSFAARPTRPLNFKRLSGDLTLSEHEDALTVVPRGVVPPTTTTNSGRRKTLLCLGPRYIPSCLKSKLAVEK
ncbi:hypothetical protein BJV77DRAFT_103724 [Russula vinacea]|nr:hypothetical protein BJV77DRAFT_103724 [Russula vinacea]